MEAHAASGKDALTGAEAIHVAHDFGQVPVFSTSPMEVGQESVGAVGCSVYGQAIDSIGATRVPSPGVLAPSRLQAKPAVNTPGDRFESEADAVADQVTHMPDAVNQRQCQDGADTSEPGANRGKVRQIGRLSQGNDGAIADDLAKRLGSGTPLDTASRSYFEPRFGYDFGSVRVHADAKAAASARDLGALAYTVGSHLVFADAYNPSSIAGRKLLAHELTHYMQQSRPTGQAAPVRAPIADAKAATESNRDAQRPGGRARTEVTMSAPIGIARKGDPAAHRSYWFQNRPPEKPRTTSEGIEITPRGQVFVDPSTVSLRSPSLGTIKVRFAGLDTDFRNGRPTAQFAAAEKAILKAISGAMDDMGSLPAIENAPSMKAARAQRRQDETVRARLKESVRTLDGKTLNIFIATDLSVAEKMSMAPLSLRTEQIFVRADDIGDAKKLEAGIRIPLIALTGGEKGLTATPGGSLKATNVTALSDEQAKEAVLHEMVHVMLINKGISAAQVWQAAKTGIVTGPDEVKRLAEDVLFRYLRAQEEIFVYTAIAGMYTGFAANKAHYVDFTTLVEAWLHDVGGKLATPTARNIDVKEKIGGGKKKQPVTWSIAYKIPRPMHLDAAQIEVLKVLQKFDIGS